MDNSTSAVNGAEQRKRRKAEYAREYRQRVKTDTNTSGAREERLARNAACFRLYRARKKEERINKLRD
jgi:predicted YcjX-like family ATPase